MEKWLDINMRGCSKEFLPNNVLYIAPGTLLNVDTEEKYECFASLPVSYADLTISWIHGTEGVHLAGDVKHYGNPSLENFCFVDNLYIPRSEGSNTIEHAEDYFNKTFDSRRKFNAQDYEVVACGSSLGPLFDIEYWLSEQKLSHGEDWRGAGKIPKRKEVSDNGWYDVNLCDIFFEEISPGYAKLLDAKGELMEKHLGEKYINELRLPENMGAEGSFLKEIYTQKHRKKALEKMISKISK